MNFDWLVRHLHLPPKRVVLWHSVAAVPLGTLLALGAYLSYHYHVLADENRQRVNQSYELLDGIDAQFSSVEAAALAERDFVITGDNDALKDFTNSAEAFRQRALKLAPLVRTDPMKAQSLAEIDDAITAQFTQFSQAIDVRQTQGFEGARAAIALQGTTVSMIALRQKIDTFTSHERGYAGSRIQLEQEHEHHVVVSGISIALASLLVRIGVALWVRRAAKRRELQEPATST